MTVFVSAEDAGQRVDAFVGNLEEALSRSAVQRLCEAGLVLVNGKPAGKNLRLKTGDSVCYTPPEPVKLDALPEDIPLVVPYEDSHLLVVDKPQGMVVHPAPGNLDKTLVNALLFYCDGRLSSINGVVRPGIVHRIDKDTSGLLVVAKDDKTHEGLARQFAEHSIDRVYYAVVHGCPKQEGGRIEAPIGRHPTDRRKMCVTEKNSRFAATNFEVVRRFSQFSLLRLRLETGRTHQIRVHLKSIGYPVAGDPLYGPAKAARGLSGQCLHAAVLGFEHPVTGLRLRFESPLPAYFTEFLRKLEGEDALGPL